MTLCSTHALVLVLVVSVVVLPSRVLLCVHALVPVVVVSIAVLPALVHFVVLHALVPVLVVVLPVCSCVQRYCQAIVMLMPTCVETACLCCLPALIRLRLHLGAQLS